MHPFPHHYEVSATTAAEGDVILSARGVSDIASQAPLEFDGSGDRWSPESLLVAAVTDCFALSFRAIASASRLPFVELNVTVDGVLDMVDQQMKFTVIEIQARLAVTDEVDPQKAERLLHKAEQSCLVTNSMNAEIRLQTSVSVV